MKEEERQKEQGSLTDLTFLLHKRAGEEDRTTWRQMEEKKNPERGRVHFH